MFHYSSNGDFVNMFSWFVSSRDKYSNVYEHFEDDDGDNDNDDEHSEMDNEEKKEADELDQEKYDKSTWDYDQILWALRIHRRKGNWRQKIEALTKAVIKYPDNIKDRTKQLNDTIQKIIDLHNQKSAPPPRDVPDIDIEDPEYMDDNDKHVLSTLAKEKTDAKQQSANNEKEGASATQNSVLKMVRQYEKDYPRDKKYYLKNINELNELMGPVYVGHNHIMNIENSKAFYESEKIKLTKNIKETQRAYSILLPPGMTQDQANDTIQNMYANLFKIQKQIYEIVYHLGFFKTFRKDIDTMIAMYPKAQQTISITPGIEETFVSTLNRAKQYVM